MYQSSCVVFMCVFTKNLRSIKSTHDAAAPGRGGAPVAVPTLPFEPAALHGLRLGLHQEVARHQGPDGYFVIAQALTRLHDFAVVDESNCKQGNTSF